MVGNISRHLVPAGGHDAVKFGFSLESIKSDCFAVFPEDVRSDEGFQVFRIDKCLIVVDYMDYAIWVNKKVRIVLCPVVISYPSVEEQDILSLLL